MFQEAYLSGRIQGCDIQGDAGFYYRSDPVPRLPGVLTLPRRAVLLVHQSRESNEPSFL